MYIYMHNLRGMINELWGQGSTQREKEKASVGQKRKM